MLERREVARIPIDRDNGLRRINCMGPEHKLALKQAKSGYPDSSITWHVDDGEGGSDWRGEIVITARP